MRKIYLFIVLCCLSLAAFGTTTTVYVATGTATTGYVVGNYTTIWP